jgi:5-methyltetrahydropteroyltriglutamate--homocysteine methyltransferase
MVQFFAEQLDGCAVLHHGWVQSYGSRCVRPPLIFGDIRRPKPMTTRWTRYAQSLTEKLVKGMLTGPVTMVEWSFVRDDIAKSEVAFQIALAIRDEVADLEQEGIAIIQIDEAAFRQGLPLRRKEWQIYLDWATLAFRLASSGAHADTQIHTHMCYSDFSLPEIIRALSALDVDVISIENARSRGQLLLVANGYHGDIGPGVWDIHSKSVPTTEEIEERILAVLRVLPALQVWVNPDCGLKTRRYEEVILSLRNMVESARRIRARF